MISMLTVLDKGYVKLVDSMGKEGVARDMEKALNYSEWFRDQVQIEEIEEDKK